MCFLQLESGVNTLEETGHDWGEFWGWGGGGGKGGKGPKQIICMYVCIEANFRAGGT